MILKVGAICVHLWLIRPTGYVRVQASEVKMMDRFLNRRKRLSCIYRRTSSTSELFDAADESLFKTVLPDNQPRFTSSLTRK